MADWTDTTSSIQELYKPYIRNDRKDNSLLLLLCREDWPYKTHIATRNNTVLTQQLGQSASERIPEWIQWCF